MQGKATEESSMRDASLASLSIRHKIVAICSVLSVLTAVVSGAALWALSGANHALQRATKQTLPAVELLLRVERDL